MSNASQVLSSYVEEVTFGVTPNATLKDMRIAGHSIKRVVDLQRSAEIRGDRQNAENIAVGVNVAGSIPGEMSYGTWDDFLQYTLQSAGWAAIVTNTGAIYAMQTGPTAIHRSTGSWASDGFTVGRWVQVSGFANAGNNGRWKISAITGSGADLQILYAGTTPTTEAEGATVTVKLLGEITNGVTQKSISIEDKFGDLSNIFRVFSGITFNGCDITLQESGPVLISFDVLGKDEVGNAATAGSGNTAVNTNPVMSSGLNIAAIQEAAQLQTSFARATISVRNNLRRRGVLGSISAQSFGAGDFEASGNFDNYFSSTQLAVKFLAISSSFLIIQLLDSLGQGYIIETPSTKYSEGSRTLDGKSADVFGKYVFNTRRSTTEGITMRIVRFT